MNKRNRLIETLLIVTPTLIGIGSAILTKDAMKEYRDFINKPFLSPPATVFPIAWTILYILMGIAAGLVYTSEGNDRNRSLGLTLHITQLILNFFWSIIFFNLKQYLTAFISLVILWLTVLSMITNYRKVNKTAFLLNIPYLAWLTFAAYLNLGICFLN